MYYLSALSKTISFIEDNLYTPFTLDDLERVNGFTRSHFSKLFHAFTGYKISEYIRGRRLAVATMRLNQTNDKIIDIAFDLQFSSQESFSRSFCKVYGVPPGKFRKVGCATKILEPLDVDKLIWTQGGIEVKAVIKTIEKMKIVGMEYEGKNLNQEIGDLWGEFLPRIKEITHAKGDMNSYGICSPLEENIEEINFNETNDFKYLAGIEVTDDTVVPEGMKSWYVDHQKYAVFTHMGSVETLGDTYKAIYSTWLPESGYDVAFTYDFELYDENFNPGEEDSKMYIYIPIK